MSTSEWLAVVLLVSLGAGAGIGLSACEHGTSYGYWKGCAAGSDGMRQPVLVEGARKCLPHAQAVELRK